jgi:hypothetical protein
MPVDVFLQSAMLIEYSRELRRTSEALCRESQERRRQRPTCDGAGQGVQAQRRRTAPTDHTSCVRGCA